MYLIISLAVAGIVVLLVLAGVSMIDLLAA